jgi:hypothetical protein
LNYILQGNTCLNRPNNNSNNNNNNNKTAFSTTTTTTTTGDRQTAGQAAGRGPIPFGNSLKHTQTSTRTFNPE